MDLQKIFPLLLVIVAFLLTSCEEEHQHEYIAETDLNYHYEKCSCGDIKNKETHYGGANTCQKLAVCEVCGVNYGEYGEHDYKLVFDDTYHFEECACGKIQNKELHNIDEGEIIKHSTDTINGERLYKCSCGYEDIELLPLIKGSMVLDYPSLSNTDIISYEGKIYNYGGSPDGINRSDLVYCYDTFTNSLYLLDAKLAAPSTSHRVVLVGSKVFIFGGMSPNGQLDTIQIHDLETQIITVSDIKMPFKANCFQIGVYQDKIYIVCGYLNGKASNSVYEFDINTFEFKLLDATFPRSLFKGAWCTADKYMYLIGGTDGKRSDEIYRFDMESYEVVKMNATLVDKLSQSRAVYDLDGNIYIYGGTNESNQLVNYVMKYNIESDTCELMEYSLPYNLANLSVVNTGNGIYLFGGDNNVNNIILKHEGNKIN